jgi:5-formyltetrahydrofolate cyclo-ligase
VTVPQPEAKAALREQLRERRRARLPAERDAVERRLALRLDDVPGLAALLSDGGAGAAAVAGARAGAVAGASAVAAYASYGTEPGTGAIRQRLAAAGVAVLLPVIRDDGLLDWARDLDDLAAGAVSPGIPEPSGPVVAHGAAGLVELGVTVLLAPALAVDVAGGRIGKAGGYYDRLIAGLDDVDAHRRPLVVAVVHDDEVLESVPVEPHDRRVDAVLTPSGFRLLRE